MQKIFKFKKCYFFSTYGSITKGSSRTPHYLNKIIQFKYYSLLISCQHVSATTTLSSSEDEWRLFPDLCYSHTHAVWVRLQ